MLSIFFKPKKRIYLDHAAATPVGPEVLEVMKPYYRDVFANASAIHKEGQEARAAIDRARLSVAQILGVRENGVVFTGSGTESNQLAIHGVIKQTGRPYGESEMISTKTQHPSILETLRSLETMGVTVHYCPVDKDGKVDLKVFPTLLNERTALISLAYANSEVGTIEDVRKIARIVDEYERTYEKSILLHIDAAQAPLWLPCGLEALGADLMSFDAGKCCGPKGVGVLAFRHKVKLSGVLLGGGQEFGLRAGTENVAGIVGAAKALEIAQSSYKERGAKVAILRDRLIEALTSLEGVVLNGSENDRLSNNVNISIPGLDSEFLVVSLDVAGVAASTKSACSGAGGGGSYVVRAMAGDEARARSTVRLTLGEETTEAEIERTIKILSELITEQKNFIAKVQ